VASQVLARLELRFAITSASPNIRADLLHSLLDEYGDVYGSKPIMASSDISGVDINPSDL
jgi:hypothetical protein